MIPDKPTTIPLYSIGDLVTVRGFGLLLTKSEQTIGVVIKGPYSFLVSLIMEFISFGFWCEPSITL